MKRFNEAELNKLRKEQLEKKVKKLLSEIGRLPNDAEFFEFYRQTVSAFPSLMPLVFFGETVRDMYRRNNRAKVYENDMSDFFHVYVPCAYLDCVVLDGKFAKLAGQVMSPPRKAMVLSLKEFKNKMVGTRLGKGN